MPNLGWCCLAAFQISKGIWCGEERSTERLRRKEGWVGVSGMAISRMGLSAVSIGFLRRLRNRGDGIDGTFSPARRM